MPADRDHHADESDLAVSGGLILPGGKVDAEALRRACEEAAERGIEDDAAMRRVVFTIKKDIQKRLDKYLTDRIGFLSRNQLQRLIDEGGVLVNERLPKASTQVRAGDVIEVVVPEPPAKNIVPEDIPLDVMYEDEHLIVLNKQPDIIVHPARSHLKGTMLSALAFHFLHRSGGGLSQVGRDEARPGVVHRLDRHTSGCIVFAKQEETHWKLGHQFEHRQVDKRYLAVVQGRVEPASELIELPIGPHPSREKGYREKYVVRHDELGKPSTTVVRVRERYATPRGDYTLVELELRTGRTHQIRVHLSYHGWPIVGDEMYGGKPFVDEAGATLIDRQALHAAVLGFTHPVRQEPLRFTAPLRGDIARLVRTLRAMSAGGERLEVRGTSVDLDHALSRLNEDGPVLPRQ